MERTRFLLWAALVVYPAFWLLDRLILPEEAFSFLSIRIAVVCVYLWALTAVYSRMAERLARPFLLASAVGSAAGLFLIAAYLNGSVNGYFADSILLLIGIGLFLPWDVGSAVTLGTLPLLLHLGINLAVHGPSQEMARPLLIIAGSGAFIVLVAVWRLWRGRTVREEFAEHDFAYDGSPQLALEMVSAGRSLESMPAPPAHEPVAVQ